VSHRGEEALQRTEKEILAEKAATLGRAGERLEAALAEVSALAQAWRDTREAGAREHLSREYDRAWRAADAARLALLIQREAVGLRDQRVVEQQYPRPPRRP